MAVSTDCQGAVLRTKLLTGALASRQRQPAGQRAANSAASHCPRYRSARRTRPSTIPVKLHWIIAMAHLRVGVPIFTPSLAHHVRLLRNVANQVAY